jgi:Resolvase, N terminal domain
VARLRYAVALVLTGKAARTYLSPKKRRPGFESLMADIESGRVTTVIAWSLDRLTRNARNMRARDEARVIEGGRPCPRTFNDWRWRSRW